MIRIAAPARQGRGHAYGSLSGVRVYLCTVVLFVGICAPGAMAAPHRRPSDRSCLVAWNAVSNRANHARLVAARPITALTLLPAFVYAVSVVKSGPSRRMRGEACVLTIAKKREIRVVTGVWRAGHVSRWLFGRPIRKTKPLIANVRLLPNGRVVKVYHLDLRWSEQHSSTTWRGGVFPAAVHA